jgi:phosphomannomutase / phosphoglucomutase
MLLAEDLLTRQPGATITYDVKCTRHLASEITKHGGNPIMGRTGHSFVKAKMQEVGALLAGEFSGHIFIKERWFGFDDGIYAAVRLAEIFSKNEHSTSEIFAALPDSINTPELKLPMPDEKKFTFMDKFVEQAKFPNAIITTIDGLRVDYTDGFGLARLSNTTPYIILRFEAENKSALERIENDFRKQLLLIDENLQLPF